MGHAGPRAKELRVEKIAGGMCHNPGRILNGISLSVAAGELVCRALEHHDGLEREFRFFQ
jgi:hypothetical protein